MSQVTLNVPAPDFALADFKGQPVRLSDFQGKSNVVLVFNRGFV
jgi:peroxiredoxin